LSIQHEENRLPGGIGKARFRLLAATTTAALGCASVVAVGIGLPISAIGAVAFSFVSMILALGLAAAGRGLSVETSGGEPGDPKTTSYKIAVRAEYGRRRSTEALRSALETTETLLATCTRLKSRVGQIGLGADVLPSAPCSVPPSGDEGADNAAGTTAVSSIEPMLKEVMSSVREMAAVLRDMDYNAKELTTSTEETAYSMSRLDAFLQDMANRGRDLETSTDAANRVALEGTKVVEEMGRENEAIISTVNEAAAAVEDLGRWSQEVGKIVEVIRDIADETNLLALNASIIAAQSGEHGKAFGVVAEEIRGLAERTSSSTKEISDLVKAVQKNVANVVNGMKKSLQRVERGELLTRNAGMVLEKVFESFESSRNLAKQIATSTFEHKIDSSQVVRSLHKVTDIARRLQSHNDPGWSEAGETLGMVRALSALTGAGGGAGERASAVDRDPGAVPVPGGGEASNGQPGEIHHFLVTLDSEIDAWMDCLTQAGDTLRSRLRGLEMSHEPDLRDGWAVAGKPGASQAGRCWEIAECGPDLRSRCPAYTTGDGMVFFSGDAACVPRGKKPTLAGGRGSSELTAGQINAVVHKVGMGK
jgi:methyl-accepting chemotaxis protein